MAPVLETLSNWVLVLSGDAGNRFQPELEKTVKKTERTILLAAVAVAALVAVIVYALIK